jgi:chemotaxis protein MotB
MAKGSNKGDRPIIIRREEVVAGGHHGGAWKLAYADFMTAMMAFFLLMWLVNMTSVSQRQGLADYFSPSNALSHGTSGYGAPFGGHTPYDDGSLASDQGGVQIMKVQTPPVTEVQDDDSDVPSRDVTFRDNGQSTQEQKRRQQVKHPGGPMDKDAPKPGDALAQGAAGVPSAAGLSSTGTPVAGVASASDAALQAERQKREKISFEAAAQQIRDLVAQDPTLSDLGKQLMVDITPEGLRIQLMDEEHQPMFASGSTVLNDRARALLLKILPVLLKLPEKLSFAGHTDAAPYRGGERTNWELSAERANATRHLFADAGLPESRVETVTGRADRDPLLPATPLAAANRRIAIVVLRDTPATRLGR